MRKIYPLLMLFYIMLNAQNQRFIYEYKLVTDSTNKGAVKTEIMNLDITKKGSEFYSYTVYHSDSLMKINLEKQLQATGSINITSDMKKGNVRYSVSKSYPDFKLTFHTKVFSDSYKVTDERTIKWKILAPKNKIGEWNVQKAETNFAGRHWIAWFSSEIPIQDGPYKFCGLPGLIVKIEDTTGSHIFELKGIKNTPEFKSQISVFSDGNEISINRKQYEKIQKDYENDPTKGLKQMSFGGASIIMTEKNANNDKFMKERERQIKEEIKENNNKIELAY